MKINYVHLCFKNSNEVYNTPCWFQFYHSAFLQVKYCPLFQKIDQYPNCYIKAEVLEICLLAVCIFSSLCICEHLNYFSTLSKAHL